MNTDYELLKRPFRVADYELISYPDNLAFDENGNVDPYRVYVTYTALKQRFDDVFGPLAWMTEVDYVDNVMVATVSAHVEIMWLSHTGVALVDSRTDNGVKGAKTNAIRNAMYGFGVADHIQHCAFRVLNAAEIIESKSDNLPAPILSMTLYTPRTLDDLVKRISISVEELRDTMHFDGVGQPEDYLATRSDTIKLSAYLKHKGLLG